MNGVVSNGQNPHNPFSGNGNGKLLTFDSFPAVEMDKIWNFEL